MYTAFFGLREKPFALSPDPRFLFLSEAHREALAHLLYGIEQGEGFIAVTGEVGTGKTTLCRTLLRRLGGEVEVAFLFNPKLSAQELLESILVELGVALPDGRRSGSARELVDALNQFLLEKRAAGKRVLLIIDEAQGLIPETLEQIRLLSNLETESDKLIQILLLGQPELDAMLESPELRQLRQRIGVRWRLGPLSREETAAYVRHRLRVSADAERDHIFEEAALGEVFRFSGGVPRLVNLVCDRALLASFGDGAPQVSSAAVGRAAAELRGDLPRQSSRRRRVAASAAALGILAAAAAGAVVWLGGPRAVLERSGLDQLLLPVVGAEGVEAGTGPVSAMIHPSEGGESEPAAPSVDRLADESAAAAIETASSDVAATPPPPQRVDDLARALALRSPGSAAAESYAAVLDAWSMPAADPAPEVLSFPEVVGEFAARGLGVFSFSARDLDVLRVIDHPVLLDIEAADGVRRVVALRQLGDGEAELDGVVANGPVLVPVDELRRIWFGDAHLVWRDFEPLPELILRGDAGDGVFWLQEALAEIGYSPGRPSGYFDAATESAVRTFQADRQLEPDGAVGPLTKMALYRALARYAVPHVAQQAALAGGAG